MKRAPGLIVIALCVGASSAFAGTVRPSIEGTYLESRSCDVYTAACFANSEIGLKGQEATMAWHVTRGAYQGVDLGDLKVVAVVRAKDTLTDTAHADYRGKAVMIVDERATPVQRDALIALAKDESRGLIDTVVRVESAPITMGINENGQHGYASLTAGDLVTIETRCLHEGDKHCGNDEAYYPPLTNVRDAMVAFTELDRFAGQGLGVTWDDSGRRSAYLATFAK